MRSGVMMILKIARQHAAQVSFAQDDDVTMEGCGALQDCRYLLHDRDAKYTQSFRAIIASGQVEPLALPARSPNLNAYAERWVRSVSEGGVLVQGCPVR
jgi:hypothetical protein